MQRSHWQSKGYQGRGCQDRITRVLHQSGQREQSGRGDGAAGRDKRRAQIPAIGEGNGFDPALRSVDHTSSGIGQRCIETVAEQAASNAAIDLSILVSRHKAVVHPDARAM
jgi:hypothetical protein